MRCIRRLALMSVRSTTVIKGASMRMSERLNKVSSFIQSSFPRYLTIFIFGEMATGFASLLPFFERGLTMSNLFEHGFVQMIFGFITGNDLVRFLVDVENRSGAIYLLNRSILATLAPYFFPLFTVFFILLSFCLLRSFRGISIFLAGFFYPNYLGHTVSSPSFLIDILCLGLNKPLGLALFFMIHSLIMIALFFLIRQLALQRVS